MFKPLTLLAKGAESQQLLPFVLFGKNSGHWRAAASVLHLLLDCTKCINATISPGIVNIVVDCCVSNGAPGRIKPSFKLVVAG